MESVTKEASKELAEKLSVESLTRSTIETFESKTKSCMKRIQDTTELTNKVQNETDTINDMFTQLRQKNEELQSTFDKIDKLELLINKVKGTYNAVADNLDHVEKAVSASTPFRIGNQRPVQPYFPPPRQVDIYTTDDLFASFSLQNK